MKPKSHQTKKNSLQSRLRVGLSVSCAVLFSFFFLFAQASSDAAVARLDNCDTPDELSLLSNAHIIGTHTQPFHLPISPAPTPTEQESKDETETKKDSDHISDAAFTSFSITELFNSTGDKCLLQQLSHSRENRKELSLFVLHHSWKSYLL